MTIQRTRTEQLRETYSTAVAELIAAHAVEVGSDEGLSAAALDGLRMIPVGPFEEGLKALFGFDFPLPEISEQTAEVRTPARLTVDARCPRCGQTATGSIFVTADERTKHGGAQVLELKGKTAPIAHSCGQTHVVDVTPTEVEGQLSIDELAGPRCRGMADAEGTICDHVEDEHPDVIGTAADGSAVRPCKVAGCGCDDLRLPEPSFVAELPEGETDGGHPTGDDAEVGPGPEAVDACPWPGCIRGANHGGKHSKGAKE
jgi:hypothetical protein